MKHETPEILLLILPWGLFCLILLINQKSAINWLNANVAKRFLKNFTRYTARALVLHLLMVFGGGASLIWAVASPYKRGRVNAEETARHVYLIIDASYSMFARDTYALTREELRGKTRFEAAKDIAVALAAELQREKTGLITFSGSAITRFYPTPDSLSAVTLIANLAVHSMRHTGSDFGSALGALIHAVHVGKEPAIAVLLSDGEAVPDGQDDVSSPFGDAAASKSPAGDVTAKLNALKSAGIPVHTVGIGTETGTEINLYEPEDYLSRSDNPRVAKTVTTSRNAGFLRHIAQATGGKYFALEDGAWIEDITEAIGRWEPSANAVAMEKIGKRDLSAWPLTLFLVLFFLEIAYLFPRRAMFALAGIALMQSACDNRTLKAHLQNENGVDRYEVALFDGAGEHFESSALYRVREEIPLMNLGNNEVQKKDYNSAHTYFQQAVRADPEHADAYFNDGVALFLWGEDEIDPKGCFLAKTAELLDQAIARFDAATRLGRDGSRNSAYIKKRIRDMYVLHDSAVDCPDGDPEQSYRSKHAPPPPQNGQGSGGTGGSADGGAGGTPALPQGTQGAGGTPVLPPSRLSQGEKDTLADELKRIKKDSSAGTDFRQTGEEQMPTDKSEVDENLYW